MGSRPYMASQERQVSTRKQIKAQLIRQKNKFRLAPECVVAGAFCDDWPSTEPLHRADLVFFHTSGKRYFVARLVTLKYRAYEEVKDSVEERLNGIHPYPAEMFDRSLQKVLRGKNGKVLGLSQEFTSEFAEACEARDAATPALILEKANETQNVSLHWRASDVDAVSAYIDAVLDVDFIDESVIRSFLKEFREIGEPFYPGIISNRGEVNVALSFIVDLLAAENR